MNQLPLAISDIKINKTTFSTEDEYALQSRDILMAMSSVSHWHSVSWWKFYIMQPCIQYTKRTVPWMPQAIPYDIYCCMNHSLGILSWMRSDTEGITCVLDYFWIAVILVFPNPVECDILISPKKFICMTNILTESYKYCVSWYIGFEYHLWLHTQKEVWICVKQLHFLQRTFSCILVYYHYTQICCDMLETNA